jgi:iron complex transport system ATP-binding protein
MTTLAAHALTLGFPQRPLCRGLEVQVHTGECWAVLGNNGSGKSTLLRALAGLDVPLAGEVRLDGTRVPDLSAVARARAIGLLLQDEAHAFWGTVADYVVLGRYPYRGWMPGWSSHDESIAQAALQRMDLGGRESQALITCSGGERQRARLALMLAQDPVMYLLDEPLQHLDLRHQLEVLACFRQLARDGGKAVVMVLHDPARARAYCDHALLLFDDGSSRAGTAAQLLTRETLERLYGCPVE